MKPTLVIGSKNYSSWSLRPWLFSRKVGFEFEEQVINLAAPDYRAQIAAVSPTGRVPLLLDGDLRIWDSLAICEYVADVCGRGLPEDRPLRALARCVGAEMHSGFQTLRDACPMNVRARNRHVAPTAELAADIARIDALWCECRAACGTGGPWLLGEFSIADAMFAPVVLRFQTYAPVLSAPAQRYMDEALKDSALQAWQAACAKEDHVLDFVDRVGLPASG
jgi:glutathione S-transferase